MKELAGEVYCNDDDDDDHDDDDDEDDDGNDNHKISMKRSRELKKKVLKCIYKKGGL